MFDVKLRRLAALCAVATVMLAGSASALAAPPEGDEGMPIKGGAQVVLPEGDDG
jgi:hypothetical protein